MTGRQNTGAVPRSSGYGQPSARSSGYGPTTRSSTPRQPVKSSGYGPPGRPSRASGSGRPTQSSSYGRPAASSTSVRRETTSVPAVKPKFTIPLLGLLPKEPPKDPFLERLKKRTIRRNAPAGEDIKKIKEIVKSLNQQVIGVQEYVGLVSPYTGDAGNVLRTVMAEDLSSFRKMAKAVYDTMTQDVSDVLANEQIYLTNNVTERCNIYQDKILRTIGDIHSYIPTFDFGLYYKDPNYLSKFFPVPEEAILEPEEELLQRRQLVYHRLEWLRSEGTRLNEENKQLQARLKQLKKQQRDELYLSKQQEEIAEVQKNQLETTEANLQDQLEELNESVQITLVSNEESLRLATDTREKPLRKKADTKSRGPKKQTKARKPWNVQAAQDMEVENFAETASDVVSNVSIKVATATAKGAIKKQPPPKSKFKRPPKVSQEEAFHYSPPRSPPRKKERPPSPFHYSPPKSPLRERPITSHYSPPARETRAQPPPGTSVETVQVETSTVVDRNRALRQLPGVRRNLAPRDSWSGFG